MKILISLKSLLAVGVFMSISGILNAQVLNVVITDSTAVSCNSVCDGAATAFVTGGTAPYTYQWVDLSIPDTIAGQTDSSITGLCDGIYAIVVTDGVGAIDSAFVTITEPSIFFSSITSQVNVSCANSCDGTATATPSGGTLPYTYLWLDAALVPLNPLQTDSGATNLCALNYAVQIVDANGCISVLSVTITEPGPLSIGLNSMSPAQCVVCDGVATVSASGGTPPYSFLWNDANAQTTSTADSLCTSTYQVAVTDSKGCIATLDVVVMGPNGFFSAINSTANPTCSGSCDGTAEVTGSGGILPYAYTWINLSIPDTITGAINSNISGLCTGSYIAAVTDNNGCISTIPIINITEPPLFSANMIDSSGVTCFGDSDGTATVTVVNGVSPFNYSWSSGGSTTGSSNTTNTEIGLSPGVYSVTVEDSNNCLAMDSVVIVTPLALTAAITDSNAATCGGLCDGDATVTPGGGTPPYSFLWDSGNTPNDPATSGLCAGAHPVTISDTSGCTTVAVVTITEPLALLPNTVDSTLITCNGGCDGDATIQITGGVPPYTYSWFNGDTGPLADSLCAGNHLVTITDSNNCTIQDSVLITEPSAMTLDFTDSVAICEPLCDGEVTASPLGGTSPYTFLWGNGDTIPLVDSLCSGIHQLTVTDALGCVVTDSVTILSDTLPIIADAGFDVQICTGESTTLNASGGISYSWNPSTALSCSNCPNPETTPASTSSYTLVATNLACVDSDQVIITVNVCILDPLPEIFTPNDDGTNDVFEIPNIEQFPTNKITIFNQWGDIVFSTAQYHNIDNNWKGETNGGKRLPDGTYFYVVELGDGSEPISGPIMIHR